MDYEIIISARANSEIQQITDWYHQQSPVVAEKWHDDILDAICKLEHMPARCPIAHDVTSADIQRRQLLFGKKHGQYRILFRIKGKTVYVLRVYHTAQEQ